MLKALVCPSREDDDLNELLAWSAQQQVLANRFTQDDLSTSLKSLIEAIDADLVVVFGFPYLIPEHLLSMPAKGFINIHFSKLPAYRGPSPMFWQIRNGEKTTGISIHKMDGGWDSGAVLRMLEVPIFPGETTGLCTARLAQLSVGLLKQLLDDGLNAENTDHTTEESYFPRPNIADMCIDWTSQSASEIAHLVNACNPLGGAVTSLNQKVIQILEVSPADLPERTKASAGSIIHASTQHGLFVVCADGNALRINVVKMKEGIMSGAKMVALGIKEGMQFEDKSQEFIINRCNHN